MEPIKNALKPLTDLLPQPAQDFLDAGGWWAVVIVAGLLVLWIAWAILTRLLRALFGRKPSSEIDSDREHFIDLTRSPLPTKPPGERLLTVYHLPARIRVVVVAPAGNELQVDATQVEKLLDLVVPGLGEVTRHDRPLVRVWPGQLSHSGFAATFRRRLQGGDPEGVRSRWVLVAGRAQIGKQTLMIGLGLWTDESNAIGRLTLEPHQWLDVLRLKANEG